MGNKVDNETLRAIAARQSEARKRRAIATIAASVKAGK